MPDNIRAHVWTAVILFGAIAVVWFIFAHPKVILWLIGLAVVAAAYYVLYLVVRARMEGFDEPSEDAT